LERIPSINPVPTEEKIKQICNQGKKEQKDSHGELSSGREA
jgi:hypothetical protein